MPRTLASISVSSSRPLWDLTCRRYNLGSVPWIGHTRSSSGHAAAQRSPPNHEEPSNPQNAESTKEEAEQGAMSRRLEQMSDESLETGGRGAQKAVSEAGFDEDLKRRLEERIANANFRNENASSFAEASLPSHASKSIRETAGAAPWSGTESTEDAALRMLMDSHKPLRGRSRKVAPSLGGPPTRVDTGRPRRKSRAGQRLASARDRTSIYNAMKDSEMTELEREQFQKEMRDRFEPHARAVPATIQGLASLANERIEDAIARGQFKNLPRGKKLERDYNASSPFIDTTEYFMNKIIQKQEIVPPWIEKQQELVATATRFRARLRNDWKRHAARSIASRGGSLEEQVQRAEAFAAAERSINPQKRKTETISTVDKDGHLSQISLAGELKKTSENSPEVSQSVETITITNESLSPTDTEDNERSTTIEVSTPTPPSKSEPGPAMFPFRDPDWEKAEASYLNLSITNLNSITRSYNLQAPDLAKKPYFDLDRELKACYAEVAPQLASVIVERARSHKAKGVTEDLENRVGGIMGRFGGGQRVKVRDEREGKQYGFKQFWRDLFAKE